MLAMLSVESTNSSIAERFNKSLFASSTSVMQSGESARRPTIAWEMDRSAASSVRPRRLQAIASTPFESSCSCRSCVPAKRVYVSRIISRRRLRSGSGRSTNSIRLASSGGISMAGAVSTRVLRFAANF